MTGAKSIIELVKKIHDALHENWNTFLTVDTEKSVTDSHTFLIGSGSISVNPHNLSYSVFHRAPEIAPEIGKIFHPGLSSNFSYDFPYSWSKEAFHPLTENFMNSPTCSDGTGHLKTNLICPVRIRTQPCQTLPDLESTKEAKRFLNERKCNPGPYFLAIGFHKPHIPFKFPKGFLNFYPKSKFDNFSDIDYKPFGIPNVAWNPFNDIRRRDDVEKLNISFPFGPIPKDFRISIRQGYYASISYIDYLFGTLMDLINFNNTIIILTSDHGWSLGEHAEWAKYSNFEVAVRVPLIVYSPEFKFSTPRKIENIVELIDLFPTVVDLAKLPPVSDCESTKTKTCSEGKSFYKLLLGSKSSKHKYAISQYPRPGEYPTEFPNSDKPKLRDIKIMGYSVRTKNFRYTLWIKFNPRNFKKGRPFLASFFFINYIALICILFIDWNTIYGEELYDHRLDPKENMNLSDRPEFDNIKNKLRKILIKETDTLC